MAATTASSTCLSSASIYQPQHVCYVKVIIAETALEGFGIERRQDVAEVVVRGRSKLGTRPCEAGMGSWRRGAVPERPEAAQKLALLLAEASGVDDRLGSRQHGQQAQQQDLVQPIHHLAALPWIRQITEMLQKTTGSASAPLSVRALSIADRCTRICGPRQIQPQTPLSPPVSPDRPADRCRSIARGHEPAVETQFIAFR